VRLAILLLIAEILLY